MVTTTPAVHDILRAFEEFGRAQREIASRLTRSLDLPRASIGLLRYLNAHGPVQIGCAAQHFRVDLSVTSRQVSALVDAGLAARDVDHDDRRARTVVLTEQGRAKVAELGKAVESMMAEMFATLETVHEPATFYCGHRQGRADAGRLTPRRR